MMKPIVPKRAIALAVLLFAAVLPAMMFFCTAFFCTVSFAAAVDEDPWDKDDEDRLESFDFSFDIRTMIQMNPDFSTYPGTHGVIWLKKLNYSLAPEGGMERRSQWILLGRRGLDPRWLVWNIPVPPGGEAEILEASVYSPGSAAKIMDARAISEEDAVRTAVFSDLPDEFILVVSWRERFPHRLTVDDLVWTSESLPVWEQLIGVMVPAGHPLYTRSSPEVRPGEREVDGRRVCEWQIINVAAEARATPRAGSRRYVAFGAREGKAAAARVLRTLSSVAIPSVTRDVQNFRGTRPDAGRVESFLRWMYDQPELTLRDGGEREIPNRPPWTKREKLLLAYNGLKEAGVDVRLLWRMAWQPEENQPVCDSMAVAPVLAISAPDRKKEPFYCDMEYRPVLGEKPLLLQGQTLYAPVADGKIEERRVPESGAAENRLSAVFDLTLSEEGILSGVIRLQARNAWRRLLIPLSGGDPAPLIAALFPQPPRYSGVDLRDRDAESELLITLAGTQAIRGIGGSGSGSNILVFLPALIPNWFEGLSRGPWPYALRFPFLMDVKITLTLPSSTENVMLPTPTDRNMGKIKYTESYKLNRKRTLTAEAHMTVATAAIAEETGANLNSALQGWRLFMTRSLPVQLKSTKQ